MSSFIDRILKEKSQLYEKIDNLENIVEDPNADHVISDDQLNLMKEQLCVMREYASILEKRINL